MNKNYGGGGKKLTRKNRKYLMKLYKKNRTRKQRGGVGKKGSVSWNAIYWNELDSIRDYAVSQLNSNSDIPTKVHDEKALKDDCALNIQLIKELKLLRGDGRVYGPVDVTFSDEQNEFLDQFCTDTPCCVISGGGKIDDSDGRVRLYKTIEELNEAKGNGMVQHYLVNVSKRNRYNGEEKIVPTWLTNEEYDKLHAEMLLKIDEEDADDRIRTGKTMMNTLASDEVNKDWELYEAAWILVEDVKLNPRLFSGTFPFGVKKRFTFSSDTKKGGGTELPTFESTKTKLKEILEKVPPDNEFSPFSKKILDNFDSFKQESFNKFVDITYKNLDDIMRGSKQKGGNGDERRSPYDIQCSICQDELVPEFNSDMQRIHACSYCNKTFHEQCLRDWRNECPLCRTVGAFQASIWPNNQPPQQQPDNFATIVQVQEMALRQLRRERRETRLHSYRTIILGLYFVLIGLWMILLQYDPNGGGNWLVYAGLLTYFLGNFGLSDDIKIKIMRFCERCYRWWTVDGRVRILRDLGVIPGGGKKTRRKRYKRNRRTKRKMRKKRGGVKTGDMVEKKYKMDELDADGNPTGKKFWQSFKGIVRDVNLKNGNITIYWFADNTTDVLNKNQRKSLTIIPPKPVAIGNMHQASIPPRTGVSYTGEEDRFKPLPQEYLTPAVKPEGYVPGIQQEKTNDSFSDMMENPEEQLKKLKSMK